MPIASIHIYSGCQCGRLSGFLDLFGLVEFNFKIGGLSCAMKITNKLFVDNISEGTIVCHFPLGQLLCCGSLVSKQRNRFEHNWTCIQGKTEYWIHVADIAHMPAAPKFSYSRRTMWEFWPWVFCLLVDLPITHVNEEERDGWEMKGSFVSPHNLWFLAILLDEQV